MNIYQECGELRKTLRVLIKTLEELLWVSYGAKLSEEDLKVIAEAKRLIAECQRILGK